MASTRKFIPDTFTIMLVGVVILASILPAAGTISTFFDYVTQIAIAVLFFLHGARLSRAAILAGIKHWRLHAMVLGSTFLLFPVLGLLLKPVLSPLIGAPLYLGVLYLCALPSTVQSSIAMVSMARGNISAAVCSASSSTLLGIFMTPFLAGILIGAQDTAPVMGGMDAIVRIMLQLFVPFVAGHFLRPLIGAWIGKHTTLVRVVDQGSVLLVVYTAFSAAVIQGLWHQVSLLELGGLFAVDAIFLTIVLCITVLSARWFGFHKEDEITIMFCGSKKSLASGVPMANVLFPASAVGTILMPIMLFHQMQLMVCVILARRYARRTDQALL